MTYAAIDWIAGGDKLVIALVQEELAARGAAALRESKQSKPKSNHNHGSGGLLGCLPAATGCLPGSGDGGRGGKGYKGRGGHQANQIEQQEPKQQEEDHDEDDDNYNEENMALLQHAQIDDSWSR